MTDNNNSNVICLVTGAPKNIPSEKRKDEDFCSAVLYYEDVDLKTFKHGKVPEKKRLHTVKSKGRFTWEGETLDVPFGPAPELRFHIIIFPKDGKDLTGGAAYAQGDSTKSNPKVFHIYPAKELDDTGETIMLDQKSDDGFDYSCLYYGTENNQVIDALMGGPKKDPDVVSWTNYISLVAKVARLENEATKSKEENENLRTENGGLKQRNEALSKGNEDLRKGNEDLRKGSEDLRKGSEDLRKGSEDLKKGSEELRKRNEDLKKEKDRLQAKDDRLQAAVKAAAKVIVDAIEDLKNDDKNKTSNTGGEKSRATE